jgi:UPF0755 protein
VSNTPGGQLPPEYEPVHHEPRRPDPRRHGPWRHAARQYQEPPQQYQDPQQQYQDSRYQDPSYQDQGQGRYAGDRFVPGFGDETPGYSEERPGYPDGGPGYPPDGGPGYPPDGGPGYPPDSGAGYADGDPGYPDGGAGYSDERAGYGGEWAGQGEWFDPAAQERGDDQQQWQREEYAERPKKKRGKVRRLAPWIALLIILIAIAIPGLYAYHLYQNKYHPADYAGDGSGNVTVEVQSGDTAVSLAPELVNKGVVASTRAFILAAEHSTNPSGLEPGFYKLHEHMQATLAYAALLNMANLVAYKVTIPEGLRLSEIIPALAKADPHLTQAQFEKALKSPQLGLPSYARGKAEGYLYPDTYQIPPNATALSVLQMMTGAFSQEVSSVNLTGAARNVHLTPAQVITVASLVQAEGGRLQDYPKIARVIYNRLAQGMKLELDSTVLYGLGTYGIIASDQQLQSDSPYNTYKYSGLPPGPIDSPGNAAIEAALNPSAGNWVYFVTVDPKTGVTLFTASESQFEQYEQELRNNLGQGG